MIETDTERETDRDRDRERERETDRDRERELRKSVQDDDMPMLLCHLVVSKSKLKHSTLRFSGRIHTYALYACVSLGGYYS